MKISLLLISTGQPRPLSLASGSISSSALSYRKDPYPRPGPLLCPKHPTAHKRSNECGLLALNDRRRGVAGVLIRCSARLARGNMTKMGLCSGCVLYVRPPVLLHSRVVFARTYDGRIPDVCGMLEVAKAARHIQPEEPYGFLQAAASGITALCNLCACCCFCPDIFKAALAHFSPLAFPSFRSPLMIDSLASKKRPFGTEEWQQHNVLVHLDSRTNCILPFRMA
ncbi:hypothetical protein TgHK011_003355 [Trichoderma gracile]|nr:hypothetical protein TgHK011_003355 [Trichoderma gracile]